MSVYGINVKRRFPATGGAARRGKLTQGLQRNCNLSKLACRVVIYLRSLIVTFHVNAKGVSREENHRDRRCIFRNVKKLTVSLVRQCFIIERYITIPRRFGPSRGISLRQLCETYRIVRMSKHLLLDIASLVINNLL